MRADAEKEKHVVRGGKHKSLLGPELTVREDPFRGRPLHVRTLARSRDLLETPGGWL